MTARTTNAEMRPSRGYGEKENNEVADGDKIFKSAHVALKLPNNADATTEAGRIGPYTGARGEVYIGEATGVHDPVQPDASFGAAPKDEVTGSSSATPPPATATAWQNRTLRDQAITLTGKGDVGKFFYLSDDNTYSLTPGARPEPIGEVRKFISTSKGDLLFYGYAERRAKAQVERLWLTTQPVVLTGTAGDKVTGYPMPFAGHLLAIGLEVTTTIVDPGAMDTQLNAELNGNDVTGGELALAAKGAPGYLVATNFASGDNSYFSRGDLLDIEISGAVAASSGNGNVFVDVMRRSGA